MNKIDFKVVAHSKNTNSFGLRGVLIVSRKGHAFEIAVYAPDAPVVGRVIPGVLSEDEKSLRSLTGVSYEIPHRKPKPDLDTLKDIWAMPTPQ